MDWNVVAPMIATVTLFLTIGGVIILRPLTRRLGDLIEVMAERKADHKPERDQRLAAAVERLADRLERLEDRQDFMERMLAGLDGRQSEQAALREPSEE